MPNTPVTIKAGTNGELYLNDLPYQRGSIFPEYDPAAQTLTLRKDSYSGNPITTCFEQHYSDIINGDTTSAFGTWQDLIDYVATAFFLRSTGGGGSGNTTSIIAFAIGTPLILPNITYTALANGAPITSVALAAADAVLMVVVGNIFSEPTDGAGYDYDGTELAFLPTAPENINVYVLISTP